MFHLLYNIKLFKGMMSKLFHGTFCRISYHIYKAFCFFLEIPVEIPTPNYQFPTNSNRIHKALLHLVKNHNANGKNHDHYDKTISQPTPADKLTST